VKSGLLIATVTAFMIWGAEHLNTLTAEDLLTDPMYHVTDGLLSFLRNWFIAFATGTGIGLVHREKNKKTRLSTKASETVKKILTDAERECSNFITPQEYMALC
jgi:hypothetical protein